ncbi:hypothetical protein LBMAG54_09530 [Nitrosopumilaceae archaeon]|nr:hypothetical protein LBMAG54_09530 [Nitrosopumilaceae archaeon]
MAVAVNPVTCDGIALGTSNSAHDTETESVFVTVVEHVEAQLAVNSKRRFV